MVCTDCRKRLKTLCTIAKMLPLQKKHTKQNTYMRIDRKKVINMSSIVKLSGENNGYYWTIRLDKGCTLFHLIITLQGRFILERYYMSYNSAKRAAKYYTE